MDRKGSARTLINILRWRAVLTIVAKFSILYVCKVLGHTLGETALSSQTANKRKKKEHKF